MKTLFLVASWKSHMSKAETVEWFQQLKIESGRRFNEASTLGVQLTNKEVVVCPPFVYLPRAMQSVKEASLGVSLGAQDISPFAEGAYTGEVNGKQVKEYAEYVIIGHSERRKNFGETNEMVDAKIAQATQAGLMPIVCVSEISQVPQKREKMIVAYEPLGAIGSGHPDTPESANQMAQKIKEIMGNNVPVLYGGSVTASNVHEFTSREAIDGVLVGGESLDAQKFSELLHNA